MVRLPRSRTTRSNPAADDAPGVLTGLVPDTRGAAGLRVMVDGRWFCTIPEHADRELGLRPGLELTEPVRMALTRAADLHAAYRFILTSLARRGFARRDLERRMVRKGHPAAAAAGALERAAAAGLIDDRAFAEHYARSRAGRGRGPLRLLRDLLAMGVEKDAAEAAISAAWSEDSEITQATHAMAVRRAAQLGDLPRPVKRRRLLAYLARRGFQGREVRQIVSEVVA